MLFVTATTEVLLAPLCKVISDLAGDVLDCCVWVDTEVGVVKVQDNVLHAVWNTRSSSRCSGVSRNTFLWCSAANQRGQVVKRYLDTGLRL